MRMWSGNRAGRGCFGLCGVGGLVVGTGVLSSSIASTAARFGFEGLGATSAFVALFAAALACSFNFASRSRRLDLRSFFSCRAALDCSRAAVRAWAWPEDAVTVSGASSSLVSDGLLLSGGSLSSVSSCDWGWKGSGSVLSKRLWVPFGGVEGEVVILGSSMTLSLGSGFVPSSVKGLLTFVKFFRFFPRSKDGGSWPGSSSSASSVSFRHSSRPPAWSKATDTDSVRESLISSTDVLGCGEVVDTGAPISVTPSNRASGSDCDDSIFRMPLVSCVKTSITTAVAI